MFHCEAPDPALTASILRTPILVDDLYRQECTSDGVNVGAQPEAFAEAAQRGEVEVEVTVRQWSLFCTPNDHAATAVAYIERNGNAGGPAQVFDLMR